jgi:hypothetical protein
MWRPLYYLPGDLIKKLDSWLMMERGLPTTLEAFNAIPRHGWLWSGG